LLHIKENKRMKQKKIADQKAKVQALEELYQEKDEEIEELRGELEELRGEEEEILDENEALEHDIDVSNKHLDMLIQEHYELLEEIEAVNDEDTGIRQVLKRTDRINEKTTKYEDKVKSSCSTLNSTLLSPIKPVPNSAVSRLSY